MLALLVLAVLFLAWSNGANDNFKGVATLWGSETASFETARLWATLATLAGSLTSLALARGLVAAFRGKGLIPEALIGPLLLAAVGGAAALTVIAATRLGMPTSTTHALTGALVGAGIAAAGSGSVGWRLLAAKFARPLLLSPLLAIALAGVVYLVLRRVRLAAGIERRTCLCVGEGELIPLADRPGGGVVATALVPLRLELAEAPGCVERYGGRVLGIEAQRAVDLAHYASGGAVCFARAVNDTPKIAALLFAAGALSGGGLSAPALAAVAAAMSLGGWLQSRRVAETMSRRITDLNSGQGLTANLVTAALVMGASQLGVPVSTTHVSCGAIFGIGLVNGRADGRTVKQILAAWITTLPLALALGALLYLGLRTLGGAA